MAMDIGTRLVKEVRIAQDAVNGVEAKLLDLFGMDADNDMLDWCLKASDDLAELAKAIRKAIGRGEL